MAAGRGRRAEDTAAGCRTKAESDRLLAAAEPNAHMRDRLESSAAAWAARASMLERLETGRAGSILP
jgi:hypothetical protein